MLIQNQASAATVRRPQRAIDRQAGLQAGAWRYVSWNFAHRGSADSTKEDEAKGRRWAASSTCQLAPSMTLLLAGGDLLVGDAPVAHVGGAR